MSSSEEQTNHSYPSVGSSGGDVLFCREEDEEILFDDTALIEAYDKTMRIVYDRVKEFTQGDAIRTGERSNSELETTSNASDQCAKKGSRSNRRRKRRKNTKKTSKGDSSEWHVEDYCLARFSEDMEWYPAQIVSIDHEKKECVVCFYEYGDEETKNLLEEIKRLPEEEDEDYEIENEVEGGKEESTALGMKIPPLPPPPPPLPSCMANVPSEHESLTAMLMSWYMTGYHTGYYQALQDEKLKRMAHQD